MSELPVKILIIDDLPEKHLVYRAVLEEPGQELVSALSGEEGLKALLQDDFAVILLDVNMPGMDGFETASLIRTRKRSAHTPIIFITAFPDEVFAIRGYSYGAVDYLLSPVEPHILRTKVAVFVQLFRLTQRVKEQAAYQIALAESEKARLTAVLENAADFVGRADAEGRLNHINRAGRKMLGLGDDERINDRKADGRLPEEALAVARRDGVWFGESVLHHRDGRDIPVAQIILAHKDGLNEIDSFSMIARDISERKQAEEAIHALAAERAQLLESEREARSEVERTGMVKDEFLANLSHELRTPLNAILCWVHLLQSPRATPEDIAEGLEVIARNARIQSQLVSDLLDMNRIVSGKLRLNLELVDLNKIVSEAVESIRPLAAEKRISLSVSLTNDKINAAADANRLQQVIWNLLTNAIKFTPEGGRVDVSLADAGEDHVEIEVTDTGEGMAPEFLPFLFDRFRQADAGSARRFGGLGLGLAIVKHLVALHGGAVHARSPGRGKGSTFTVRLPKRMQVSVPRGTSDLSTKTTFGETRHYDDQPLKGLRVLVVDDKLDAADLVRRVLEEYEAEVSVVCSAAEAFDQVHEAKPDVVISDIGMPIEDGYSLMRRIRRMEGHNGHGHVGAIALTAFTRPEDAARAFEAGYQAHIAKPFDPAELIRTVAAVAHCSAANSTDGKT